MKLAAAVGQPAPPPVLNSRHPETYVVQAGDTLWDIAAKFLRDPWNWPEIWQINPQVENPHLIFPGDTLTLVYNDNGRPAVTVTERGPVVTRRRRRPPLAARSRAAARERDPRDSVRAGSGVPVALRRARQKKELAHLPYIVANRNGLVSSAGEDFYARHATAAQGTLYNVVHLGNKLVDPDDNEMLGYEGIYIGQGRVQRDRGSRDVVLARQHTRSVDRRLSAPRAGRDAQKFRPARAGAGRRRANHRRDGRRRAGRTIRSRRSEPRHEARARRRQRAADLSDRQGRARRRRRKGRRSRRCARHRTRHFRQESALARTNPWAR